jgi:hypothetical protein
MEIKILNWQPQNELEWRIVKTTHIELYGIDFSSVNSTRLMKELAMREVAKKMIQ